MMELATSDEVDRRLNIYERLLNQEDDAKLVEHDNVLNTEELQDVDDELQYADDKKEFNDKELILPTSPLSPDKIYQFHQSESQMEGEEKQSLMKKIQLFEENPEEYEALKRLAIEIISIKKLIQITSERTQSVEDVDLRLKLVVFLVKSMTLLKEAVAVIQDTVGLQLDDENVSNEINIDEDFLVKQELKEGGYLDTESIQNMPDDESEAQSDLTFDLTHPSFPSTMKLEEDNVNSTTPKIERISEVSKSKSMIVKEDPLTIDQNGMEIVQLKTKRVKSKTSDDGEKTGYKCQVCGRHFRTLIVLEKHSKKVHEGFAYACDQCDKTFVSVNNLRAHLREVHEEPQYYCDVCNKRYPRFANLKRHKSQAHQSTEFVCTFCNSGPMSTKDYFRHHNQEMAKRVKYSCKRCEFRTKELLAYKEHTFVQHGIKLFRYPNPDLDDKPEGNKRKKKLDELLFSETEDFTKTKKASGLQRQHRIIYACDWKRCKYKGIFKRFTRHRAIEHDRPEFECFRCDFVGKNYDNIHKHFKIEHLDGKLYCDQCPHVATTKSLMRQHMASAHEGVTYQCDQCDAKTTSACALITHKKGVHQRIKVPCSEPGCGKSFADKRSMNSHVQAIHLGIKLQCSECGYSVGTKQKFKEHMKKHEDVASLRCQECDYVGANVPTLKEHIVSKHSNIRFPCEVCGILFTRKNTRRGHEVRVHGVKVRRVRNIVVGIDYK